MKRFKIPKIQRIKGWFCVIFVKFFMNWPSTHAVSKLFTDWDISYFRVTAKCCARRGIFEFKHLADNRLTKIPLDGRSFHTFVTEDRKYFGCCWSWSLLLGCWQNRPKNVLLLCVLITANWKVFSRITSMVISGWSMDWLSHKSTWKVERSHNVMLEF